MDGPQKMMSPIWIPCEYMLRSSPFLLDHARSRGGPTVDVTNPA